jgi:hypothetical protein
MLQGGFGDFIGLLLYSKVERTPHIDFHSDISTQQYSTAFYNPPHTLLLTITPSALLWAVTMAESKRGKVAKSSNGGKNGSNILITSS